MTRHCPPDDAGLFYSMPEFYIYDEETYPNIFVVGFTNAATGERWEFEISEWKNDYHRFIDFVFALKSRGAFMVGFNSVGFDYPVLHFIIAAGPTVTVFQIYQRAQAIIDTNDRFEFIVWDNERHVQQVDLQLIHHMEYGSAKTTSLKAVEFVMRPVNIGDLPYKPGTVLTFEQSRELIKYMWHDIGQTLRFFEFSKQLIDFRLELSERFGQNFMNDNDVKIGVKYFTNKLETAQPGSCYTRANGKREPRQTIRNGIPVSDIVFPYIQFDSPEFARALDHLKKQTIYDTRGGLKYEGYVDGVKYTVGTGGIHASVHRVSIYADDEYEIVDLDVSGYYPDVAIVNKLYPEHLGELFYAGYAELKTERKQHAKGTPENGMFKLAMNGVYGNSNSSFSVFFDSKFTMSITVNGQLLLLLLLEKLLQVPGVKLVQLNTDGVTIQSPRNQRPNLNAVVDWWQKFTRMELEEVLYSEMHIRDVNSYLAKSVDGKIKRIGAYDHVPANDRKPIGWHQDFSKLVVAKAAEAVLLNGADAGEFIRSHKSFLDFAIRGRAKGGYLKFVASDGSERPAQKITRYYASVGGETLLKVAPPPKGRRVGAWKQKNGLTEAEKRQTPAGTEFDEHGTPWDARCHTGNKSKYNERVTNECKGQTVTDISDLSAFPARPIDYAWYIAQVEKLTSLTGRRV